MSLQKNSTLELFKLFASYMVVFIHVSFSGKFGAMVDALARFAVPFFFFVSGFYSYGIPCEKIKTRVRNILTLLILAVVCYNLFEIATLLLWNREGLTAFLGKYTDFSTLIHLLIFNVPVSSGHLWYLLAILYVYIIFYFATKFRVKDKVIFTVSLLLLCLHIFLGEGLSAVGRKLPIWFVRNFALMGTPFFALGLFVKKYEHKFEAVTHCVIWSSAIFGILASVISRSLWGENELHIGSLFILFAIACTFIQRKGMKHASLWTALDGCSAYIYIFHIMISSVLHIAYGILGIDIYASVILTNLHPLMVCVSATIFAYFLRNIIKNVI